MDIHFLGTGNAFASGGRNAMAILLRTPRLGVLLDCGPTTLVALARSERSPNDIDLILLSHHHGDHFGGIPFLVLHGRYEGPRTKPLTVFGPVGTGRTIEAANDLFFPGLAPLPFELEIRDLDAGSVRHGDLTATAFEVEHYSRGVAFGYRVELEGKTIVFSGDTAWTEELVRQTTGADLFICECSSFDEPVGQHMSHRDLVEHGPRLGAKRTLLVHPGSDVLAREHELDFELARDGMRIEL